MKRRLDTLADRGCWISDDRIYAFVSAAGGVTELGYHGSQPVSRNSRILVREKGVLLFSIRSEDGTERPLTFNEVEWTPDEISSAFTFPEGETRLRVRASGRNLHLLWSGSFVRPVVLLLRVSGDSCFTNVQGERTWEPARSGKGEIFLECRDRIMLRPWLEREGPYAGDFLIPEPIRRVIFEGGKRSGLATKADLRPEFRDANLSLYDARVFLRLGGKGFAVSEEPESWVFAFTCGRRIMQDVHFLVQCGDVREEIPSSGTAPPPESNPGMTRSNPRISLEGFPGWESFLDSVPAIVDSCRVREFGVPRACPGRYYWLWAWDMLVTVPEALRWGDTELGQTTARFVNAHRDVNGAIPARWTRGLLPLDTPSPGGIEFLFAALAYENFLESGNTTALQDAYAPMRALLAAAAPEIRENGWVRGAGFYPDLLSSIGRNDRSAVCMETGSWYSTCRILQNIARHLGDRETEQLADDCASSIARAFAGHFWDEGEGFPVDSIDTRTAERSGIHPLFALLFLHSSLGYSLLRRKIDRAAAFAANSLATPDGFRTIPLRENREGGETVLDSWYPHWDLYALKLLRRAGYAKEIMDWLRQGENVLANLGYCPEFLALRGFREGNPDAWSHHGSASNLNCATGWYRALREAVCGLEIDPGGLTHIPLALPLGRVVMEKVRWRGGIWRIEVLYEGPDVAEISVDQNALAGCLKVPARYAGPGEHRLLIRYGHCPREPHFRELVNAEVLSIGKTREGVEVEIRPLGFVDCEFFSADRPALALDGIPVDAAWDERTGKGFFSASLQGKHTLRLALKP